MDGVVSAKDVFSVSIASGLGHIGMRGRIPRSLVNAQEIDGWL